LLRSVAIAWQVATESVSAFLKASINFEVSKFEEAGAELDAAAGCEDPLLLLPLVLLQPAIRLAAAMRERRGSFFMVRRGVRRLVREAPASNQPKFVRRQSRLIPASGGFPLLRAGPDCYFGRHMTRILVNGSKGRMGQSLLACARRNPQLSLVGAVDQGDDLEAVLEGADVVIDFTFHAVTAGVAAACARRQKALVIGTTGHTEAEKQSIRAQAATIPMVWASNYSTGVNTLFWLTRKATEILGPSYDLEVVEMHHRLKKDAPSGTATTLLEILAEVRQVQLADVVRHGREGITGERTSTEIGIHALRGGDVVGDHTVIFAADGERLELTHKASSRDTFARGALRAAEWIVGRPAGIYSMQDVLGLK
jgi:4-hydroxy-tetrahydrodipicolinate reductase